MSTTENERTRRDRAQQHRGGVIAGSGRPVEPAALEQMVSVRLDGVTVSRLRELAERRRTTLSALIREALGDYADAVERTSRVDWWVTGFEGLTVVETKKWAEDSASRSALRDVKDSASMG